MRKLIRNNSLRDYQELLSNKCPSISLNKTKMSSSEFALTDYNRLSTKAWFRNFIIDVENKFCPYCEANRLVKGIGNFQIDHIKGKTEFKEIAIAWNNLVPSCSRCNLLKGKYNRVLNPLKNDYSDIGFEFMPDIEDFTVIKIVAKNASAAASIKQLNLEEYYTEMIDEIKEKIKNIKIINLAKNNSNDYIGYNNIFGRLLECYDKKFGF